MNNHVKNDRFIVVSENISYKEILTTIDKALDKNNHLKSVKPWQLKCFYHLDKLKAFFLRTPRALSKPNVKSAFKHLYYDNSKIKNVVAYEFKPIKESITTIAEHFKKEH